MEFIVENIDDRGRNVDDRPAASAAFKQEQFRTKFTQEQKDKMCSFAEKGTGINLE